MNFELNKNEQNEEENKNETKISNQCFVFQFFFYLFCLLHSIWMTKLIDKTLRSLSFFHNTFFIVLTN